MFNVATCSYVIICSPQQLLLIIEILAIINLAIANCISTTWFDLYNKPPDSNPSEVFKYRRVGVLSTCAYWNITLARTYVLNNEGCLILGYFKTTP